MSNNQTPFRDVPERKPSIDLVVSWWGMVKAHNELAGKPLHPDELVLHFSGSGASCMVFVKDLDAAIDELKKVEKK